MCNSLLFVTAWLVSHMIVGLARLCFSAYIISLIVITPPFVGLAKLIQLLQHISFFFFLFIWKRKKQRKADRHLIAPRKCRRLYAVIWGTISDMAFRLSLPRQNTPSCLLLTLCIILVCNPILFCTVLMWCRGYPPRSTSMMEHLKR